MKQGKKTELRSSGVLVSSLYGLNTKQGIVQLQVYGTSEPGRIQMTVQDAQDLHRNLGAAIEAAITDHFLAQFMQRKLGVSDQNIGAMLNEFREFRRTLQ